MTSLKIWLPIVLIVIGLFAIAVIKWKFGGVSISRSFFLGEPLGAPAVSRTAREITAEQLAGSLRAGDANGGNTRPRRPRRNRRTPSQISTTSLPAYMKEPGDEELVIFRGPQDMEDVAMPSDSTMPPVEEQDAEGSVHSRDVSEAYPPMSQSPTDRPLLQTDEPADETPDENPQPTPNLAPPTDTMPRRSIETLNNSDETSSLMRAESNLPSGGDPRGEAPPYFEVVLNDPPPGNANAAQPVASSETRDGMPAPQSTVGRRRSAFRTLIDAFSNPASRPTPSAAAAPSDTSQNASTHSRVNSGPSVISQGSTPREVTRSRASHRPSNSGSGSFLNLTSSAFRTVSRQRSTHTLNSNHLNSPSLISLNSISSPLTHTLVRTDFTYPKSGPTPEQLKLISSRDSFARFGMPYGEDAIAFAASTSRQELPPPDFDHPGSSAHLPRAESSPSPSIGRRGQWSPTETRAGSRTSRRLSQPTRESSESSSLPISSAPLAPTPPTNLEAASSTSESPAPAVDSPADVVVAEISVAPKNSIPPPTAFKPAAPSMTRSDSRASSALSYATANESAPPTPSGRESPHHWQESTDMTITPNLAATSA